MGKNDDSSSDIFREVLKCLAAYHRKCMDYVGFHTAYLMRMISEEEFYAEAKPFIVSLNETHIPDRVKTMVVILIEVSGQQFTASELAGIFDVSPVLLDEFLEELYPSEEPDDVS